MRLGICCINIERRVIADLVEGVVWFTPTDSELQLYGDGGVAIIDQWIASHAKFFTGKVPSCYGGGEEVRGQFGCLESPVGAVKIR